MRIAMIGACPFPVPQGSQTLIADTARAMQQAGHEVHLITYGYGIGDAPGDLTVHQTRTLPCAHKTTAGPSFLKPLLDTFLAAAIRRVTREHAIDIVHAHNYEALIAALAAGVRPIVYHAHNAMADELPYFIRPKSGARALGRWLDRTFPRRADAIIAPHQRLAEYLVDCGCGAGHIAVIPPSVDATAFSVSDRTVDTPPVLYTGNLDAYQNLRLLFEAMEILRDSVPEARLIIATAQQDGDASRTEFAHTPDFDSLCATLSEDAVVACSRVSWSGYPIKLLNAMAAGKAIVCCESAAHPLVNERSGLIVPDDDARAFADALHSCIADGGLRSRLGTAARAQVLRDHAPATIAPQIEALYKKIADGGEVGPRRPRGRSAVGGRLGKWLLSPASRWVRFAPITLS
jgi:glycosyltransferase involved in cell wall biosynthesis